MSTGNLLPICFRCAHFQSVAIGKGWVCKAFPDGISSDILASRHDHREPYQGDHGITFQPIQASDEYDPNHPENPLTPYTADSAYKKFEKKAAHYVSESPDPAKACGGCYFFTSPNSCSLVAGYINPEGKCIHWMTSPQAQDAEKFDKSEVQYEAHASEPAHQCQKCDHFIEPHSCEVVNGNINAEGWCEKWIKKVAHDMQIATDPPVSEKQRRAMWAAAAGHSTLGIPQSVGKEFAEADPGGHLPDHAKDMTRNGWRKIFAGLAEMARFFGEEEQEPEHEEEELGSDAWSEEARKKALEARQRKAQKKGKLQAPTSSEHHEHLTRHGWVHTGSSKGGGASYHHPIHTTEGHMVGMKTSPKGWRFGYSEGSKMLEPHNTQQRYQTRSGKTASEMGEFLKSFHAEHDEPERQRQASMYREPFGGTSTGRYDSAIDSWEEGQGGFGARDEPPKGRAASVAFVTKDGRTLLVKRASDEKNFPGHWAFPGGQVEEGEDFEEGARRECNEEIGDCSFDSMKVLDKKRTKFGWDHVTYVVPVDKPFEPKLNHEHEDYAWADVAHLPEPMHPAVKDSIEAAMKPTPKERLLQGADEKIILEVDDQDGEIQKLLQHIQRAAGVGHSFHVVVDPEDKEYQKKFFIDGDGNCKIRDIKLAADHMMALDWARTAQLEKAINGRVSLAFDFESVREKDKDGRMKISSANISKANVCPYYGKEIPDFDKLGLDPERKYMLLRDPEELQKAAPTFNNLPILSTHVPVTSTSFPQDKVVGSTGSDCSFDGTYLKNSLGFWPQEAIDGIESNVKKQLSAGYRYRADMKPGEYKGIKYDGVMRDIEGNHLALVTEGRAGADVVVGDSQIRNFNRSTKVMSKLSTKSAQAVVAALKRRGLLALDANPEEAAELVGKLEGLEEAEGEDNFDPNSGLPSYMSKHRDEDDAEDEYEDTQERDLDSTYDKRADDARARLGRDETPAEREEREEKESAEDARKRLGRDETMQECQDRRARDRRARDYRAARDAHRSARDRLLHASDTTKKCYADMRRAQDSYDRARAAADTAKDANRADDARRAADAMAKAEDERSRAEDAWKAARDVMKSCYDSILTARDARKHARDARRMGKDSSEQEEHMTRGAVEDALRAQDAKHRTAMDAAITRERERASGFNEAMRAVRPLVGELALDSASTADDVYRTSLKILGVKTDGIHPSAFPAMFKMAAQTKQRETATSRYAHDSASSGDAPKLADLIPGVSRIRAI